MYILKCQKTVLELVPETRVNANTHIRRCPIMDVSFAVQRPKTENSIPELHEQLRKNYVSELLNVILEGCGKHCSQFIELTWEDL